MSTPSFTRVGAILQRSNRVVSGVVPRSSFRRPSLHNTRCNSKPNGSFAPSYQRPNVPQQQQSSGRKRDLFMTVQNQRRTLVPSPIHRLGVLGRSRTPLSPSSLTSSVTGAGSLCPVTVAASSSSFFNSSRRRLAGGALGVACGSYILASAPLIPAEPFLKHMDVSQWKDATLVTSGFKENENEPMFLSLKELVSRSTSFTDIVQESWTTIKRDFGKIPPNRMALFSIIGLNTLVFMSWRVPGMRGIMSRHFVLSKENAARRPWTYITSAFSHSTFAHFGFNMFAFYTFGGPMLNVLGTERFLSVFLGGALVSGFASRLITLRRGGGSLGASGGIMSILWLFALLFPQSRMMIIFLPFFSFSAASGALAVSAVDLVGVVKGWKYLDHAGHLGGAAMGLGAYQYFASKNPRLKRDRGPFGYW
eukprot:TRINITY_DN4909_c0_g1_i1.p1 TRINITY_DN4909_c0_g1~~TRINITY_DN4909_c0_g1_i1.p1  ORF type:complete len:421 (+),score=37.85 TRINITY_DN4909_c0_g1_i1:198-1460(+)